MSTYYLQDRVADVQILPRGLAPEIAHFRLPNDGLERTAGAPLDWYIKGAK